MKLGSQSPCQRGPLGFMGTLGALSQGSKLHILSDCLGREVEQGMDSSGSWPGVPMMDSVTSGHVSGGELGSPLLSG